ncbi:alpha/beta-hydrolase [Myriangium duriaei CBS 260.36]|uniref:Alpha/beta-hydrolase n=1 Tax=Myriangium duriaei CBS 260.36 TaxID=1168546 RepID=A0A9P4J323_9PEZI|nr:alpha/beta-hydrolase [Myriangium duriaei CBS 260.36]
MTANVTITEGTSKLDDGFEVYTKTWKASPEQARVLFLHGFSDQCNNYEDLFPYLASRGITIYGFDQRGWGRSVPTKAHRGLTGPTERVLADVSCMLKPIISDASASTPVFLMGHSMGGAEALTYSSLDPDHLLHRIRGTVVLAPLIALHPSTRPYGITVALGRIAAKLMPRFQMVNHLDASFLSHNEEKNKQWLDDELNHDTGTLEGMGGMLDRGAALEEGQYRLEEGKHEGGKTRILVVHGNADRINEYSVSKKWTEQYCAAQDKRFWELDGWYHNLHCEPELEMFRAEIADWMLSRSGNLKGQTL